MGNVASEGTPNNFTQILEGDGYRYYMSNSVRKAWADKPSGTYYEPIDVKLIAVTSATGAQVVYTTDGSNPTASSTAVASGTTIRLTGTLRDARETNPEGYASLWGVVVFTPPDARNKRLQRILLPFIFPFFG